MCVCVCERVFSECVCVCARLCLSLRMGTNRICYSLTFHHVMEGMFYTHSVSEDRRPSALSNILFSVQRALRIEIGTDTPIIETETTVCACVRAHHSLSLSGESLPCRSRVLWLRREDRFVNISFICCPNQ